MRGRATTALLALAATAGLAFVSVDEQPAATVTVSGTDGRSASVPVPDITLMDYTPVGKYDGSTLIPRPDAPPTDPNPSGAWVAYDTNVFESLNLPYRVPGDTSAEDPPGSGDPRYGFCPASTEPDHAAWGKCHNHQLEFLDHFEAAMTEILGEFGVVVQRHEFQISSRPLPGGTLSAPGGTGINISATVPGADFPAEQVIVAGHYDVTMSGPAPAWDSSEGHAEVIRIAKILADYWRTTGTRPSATVRFMAWDGEESGTNGSRHFVEQTIPPDGYDEVRGYFNLDPCAGGYPAFYYGNPGHQVREVVQLADPDGQPFPAAQERIAAFNTRAETVIDEVLDNLDDTLAVGPAELPIFVSDDEAAEDPLLRSDRQKFVTAVGGLLLFSSDYANFEAKGIPILNLFPDVLSMHDDREMGQVDGLAILHTPNDNLTTLNRMTNADPTGLLGSEGWAKGMEMCAHLHGWYMLQPRMGGAQVASTAPVAWFEASDARPAVGEVVSFDGTASYAYADVASRLLRPDAELEFVWDFGDGTEGRGPTPTHTFTSPRLHTVTLTVTDPATGASATMRSAVKVG